LFEQIFVQHPVRSTSGAHCTLCPNYVQCNEKICLCFEGGKSGCALPHVCADLYAHYPACVTACRKAKGEWGYAAIYAPLLKHHARCRTLGHPTEACHGGAGSTSQELDAASWCQQSERAGIGEIARAELTPSAEGPLFHDLSVQLWSCVDADNVIDKSGGVHGWSGAQDGEVAYSSVRRQV